MSSCVLARFELTSSVIFHVECDLQFVLFSGEEQNFLGSEQYAKLIREKISRYID